jgi:hypothetical protein
MPSNDDVAAGELRLKEDVKKEAIRFFQEYYASLKR